MVSALWKACSDGDVGSVTDLMSDGSQHDLEIKDQAGVTPLIEAVKNGHVEVVRLLLEKGADPTNSSAQGPPEQHTSDPAILELLSSARNKMATHPVPMEQGYPHDPSHDPSKGYYPPPGPFYYPMPPPMIPEGGVPYYPPPPPPPHHMSDPSGMSNLPPPEIARMIPCRYYPACRYGTSCMFAHPQGPYLQGPLPPPAQYPAPYDAMNPTPYPSYYPVPPPPFQTSPNGAPVPTVSPSLPTSVPSSAPPMVHSRNNSDFVPPAQPGFPPAGVPPPMPYGVVPPQYAHGPVPIPMQPHSPLGGPHSPQQSLYPSSSPGGMIPGPSQYPPQQPIIGGPYPPQGMSNGHSNDPTISPKSPLQHIQPDGYANGHRETYSHHRRGSGRRPSFGLTRKPPCLFFPAGRCKNGDDCRFPHVLDGPLPPPPPFAGRGGHRSRPSFHAHNGNTLEDRFAAMSTQDGEQPAVQAPPLGVNGINGGNISNGSSRSQSTEPGNRGRNGPGYRPSQYANGFRGDKKHVPPSKPQRLPSADEFPVLAGGSTPPLRSPGTSSTSGWNGLTAAQVLQAPAPKRDSQPGTRGASPTNGRPAQPTKEEPQPEPTTATSPPPASKLPVSFAAVAAPEAAKEVAIAA